MPQDFRLKTSFRAVGAEKNLLFCGTNLTMMQAIPSIGYSIYFNEPGYLALNELLDQKNYSKIFILVDTNTNEHCLPAFLSLMATEAPVEIIEIEPGEGLKSIVACVELWQLLTDMGADRKSLLINLGGGVITDLGGFVASTFKRGIDFINVPTTLLAMVDASVGGKTGVDLGHLKNQIGTITSPAMVVIDPVYLHTLSQQEMRSGLSEMLKHGLIADREYWEKFQELDKLDFEDIDELIYDSVRIKNDIVMTDMTENGIRKTLNFGHTLGHAIESHFLGTDTPLLHGEAVAIGMLLESFISMRKQMLSAGEYLEIKNTISDIYPMVKITERDTDSIMQLLVHDKKNEYGNIRFCLLEGIGKGVIDQEADNQLILSAFREYGKL